MVKDRLEFIISGVDQGLGVRVLHKGAWGFASTCSFKKEDIETNHHKNINYEVSLRFTSSTLLLPFVNEET